MKLHALDLNGWKFCRKKVSIDGPFFSCHWDNGMSRWVLVWHLKSCESWLQWRVFEEVR